LWKINQPLCRAPEPTMLIERRRARKRPSAPKTAVKLQEKEDTDLLREVIIMGGSKRDIGPS